MNYEKEAENAKDIIGSLYDRIKELEEENSNLQTDLSHAEDRVEELELTVDDLKGEINELEKEPDIPWAEPSQTYEIT